LKVVFLCLGPGEKMFPITQEKSLLKFLGKTLLEHQIEKALASGLDEFVLRGNEGNIQRLKEIAGKFPQAHIDLAIQMEPSRMADAVRSAEELVAGEVIVVNPGDIFQESACWGPLKYPWHILDAVEYFLRQAPGGIASSAVISEKATVEGNVTVDENVRVLENAVIRGPCYIGKNSIIGNNVLIRDCSHIGADCVVGFSTEIKHSYIGDECWFHLNYIGDSIVADRCSFGAGTATANLRLDQDEVIIESEGKTLNTGLDKLGAIIGAGSKTGINVSIMPGVRIGPNSVVGPHVMLRRDLGPGRMILLDSDNRLIEREISQGERQRR